MRHNAQTICYGVNGTIFIIRFVESRCLFIACSLDLVVNLDFRAAALVIFWFRYCLFRGPLVPVYHIVESSGFTSKHGLTLHRMGSVFVAWIQSWSRRGPFLKGAVGSADLKICQSALLSLNHHNFSNTKPIYTE